MFEYLFENSHLGAIGTNVVDDSRDIAIPVSVVPPPPPDCALYLTEVDCLAHGCYWWGDACHSEPEVPPEEIPWLIVAIVAGVSIVGAIVFAMIRK